MTPLLHFADASFSYAGHPVLSNVNLSLHEGTCSALIGANGAGKTTLLRLALGTLRPSAGTILLQGQAPAEMPIRQRARLVALVPQQLEMPFDYTVQQIVEQGRTPYLSLLRGPMPEDRLAVERALDLTDTLSLRHRIFNELSGGERQRVKIALGLAQEAKLLLLDEPTQNLDIGRQLELVELLQRLRLEGITILASIHDLHLIPDNFSAVHLLGTNGSLTSGSSTAILTAPHLAAAFRFSPARYPITFQPRFEEAP